MNSHLVTTTTSDLTCIDVRAALILKGERACVCGYSFAVNKSAFFEGIFAFLFANLSKRKAHFFLRQHHKAFSKQHMDRENSKRK